MVLQFRLLIILLCITEQIISNIVRSYGIVQTIHEPCSSHKVLNGSVCSFIIVKEYRRLIPDDGTLQFLLGKDFILHHLDWNSLSSYKERNPIQIIHKKDSSADEIMRTEMLRIESFQENLLFNITPIGLYINPATVKWLNRLLLCVSLEWGFTEGWRPATENIECGWMNQTNFVEPFFDHYYLGVSSGVIGPLNTPLIGQDPRLSILENGTLIVSFTYRFTSPLRMGYAFIELNSTGSVEFTNIRQLVHLGNGNEARHPQKNWVPFVYNDSLMFVARVNPLQVLQIRQSIDGHGNAHSAAFDYSLSEHYQLLRWKYGELRGGTNVIRIGDLYLSFFHSSVNLQDNYYKTYLMGAYTFTATPPFRLVSMSPFPIVDKSLYDGPWDPLKNRKIDYCIFPMSFFIESDNQTLALTIGYNDVKAFIMRLQLNLLLDSLVPIEDMHKE